MEMKKPPFKLNEAIDISMTGEELIVLDVLLKKTLDDLADLEENHTIKTLKKVRGYVINAAKYYNPRRDISDGE